VRYVAEKEYIKKRERKEPLDKKIKNSMIKK